MPIKYDIFKGKNIVMVVGSGVVTADEILDHLDELAADNNYITPMKKLVDYRTIESINVSHDEAYRIAKRKKELETKFSSEKCAFVSPGDLSYGTARVHEALVDGSDLNTQVFRKLEDALEWLNITIDNG